nr:MAG TPA: hypothetical protein [Caudoviricetes sp.]
MTRKNCAMIKKSSRRQIKMTAIGSKKSIKPITFRTEKRRLHNVRL